MKTEFNFETLQVHAGFRRDVSSLTPDVPIIQAASYEFESAEHARQLFALEKEGFIYSRIGNPTVNALEQKVAVLEGGVGALATASGHAAQFLALSTICRNGDNIVSSPFLYGGTYHQFADSFKRLGVDVGFASSAEAVDFESLIDGKTAALYCETIGNPAFAIPDFEALSSLAHKHNIPLIVDNTFGAGGFLCRPLELGADIVVESATKWLGGHGNSIAGIIIDGGTYDWSAGRFPEFTEKRSDLNGKSWHEAFGESAFIVKARAESLRDFGPCLSPMNAFLIIQGIETLSLRVQRICDNALQMAEFLYSLPQVAAVQYPGLKNHPYHQRAVRYLKNGFGGVLTFEINASLDQTEKFVDSLELIHHLANVGDTRTLIIQPAATTHNQLTADQQRSAGIRPSQLRLSLGIEHVEDIQKDIVQAFKKAAI